MKNSFAVSVIIVLSGLIAGCTASGDMATVTIDTGLRTGNPSLSLMDRILTALSLSTNAIAQAAPLGIDKIDLEVRSDATGEVFLTVPIPLLEGKVTVEVPAGADRRFTVSGYFYDGQLAPPDYRRVKGGHETVNLSPGEETGITIVMLDIPQFPIVTQIGMNDLQVTWTVPGTADGHHIYRASGPAGPFIRVASQATRAGLFDDIGIFPGDATYYYRVSMYNSYGEGVPSDIVSYYLNSSGF